MSVSPAGLAAAAAWLVVGSFYAAAYARFTHGQTLSGDRAATRLLESPRLAEHWPLALFILLVLAGWPALLLIDTGKRAFEVASTTLKKDRR